MTNSFLTDTLRRFHPPIGYIPLFLALFALSGCSEDNNEDAAETSPPVMVAPPSNEPEIITPSELRHRLRANEKAQFRKVGNDVVEAVLFDSGVKSIEGLKGVPLRSLDLGHCAEVSDISVLAGMPLRSLILENTAVEDLSVISGMSLEVLYLQNTGVTDLQPIKGMPLRELNLMNVPVQDLSIISTLPLRTLWIPGTQVRDITPLTGKSLESLDIEGTPIQNFDVLATLMSLKRLNIANTAITDVSILEDLNLDRIALSPETIETGMESLREMPSLSQFWISSGIGQEPQRFSSADFWERYDLGVWSDEPAPPDSDAPDSSDTNKPDDNPSDANPSGDEPETDQPDESRPKETQPADDSTDPPQDE